MCRTRPNHFPWPVIKDDLSKLCTTLKTALCASETEHSHKRELNTLIRGITARNLPAVEPTLWLNSDKGGSKDFSVYSFVQLVHLSDSLLEGGICQLLGSSKANKLMEESLTQVLQTIARNHKKTFQKAYLSVDKQIQHTETLNLFSELICQLSKSRTGQVMALTALSAVTHHRATAAAAAPSASPATPSPGSSVSAR
jgi:hypothetical protein